MRTYCFWMFLLLPLLMLTAPAAAAAGSSGDLQPLLTTLAGPNEAPVLLASNRHGDRHHGGHSRYYRGHRHVDDFFFKGGRHFKSHDRHFRSHDRHFRSHFRHDRHHFFRGHGHDRHFFGHGSRGKHHFNDRHFGVSVCVRTGSALICFNDSRRGHRY